MPESGEHPCDLAGRRLKEDVEASQSTAQSDRGAFDEDMPSKERADDQKLLL